MRRTFDLSPNARKIALLEAIHYNSDRSDCMEFDAFEQFNLSDDELLSACKEIEDQEIASIEYDDDGNMYLHANPSIGYVLDYLTSRDKQ